MLSAPVAALWKSHAVFILFLCGLCWMLISTLAAAYFEAVPPSLLPWIALVSAISVVFYLVSNKAIAALDFSPAVLSFKRIVSVDAILSILSFFYVILVLLHFLRLGYIPLIESFNATSEVEISIVRQGGYEKLPVWMRYGSDFALKSLGPSLLVLACSLRSRWFLPLLATGVFYTCGLMARSLPLILLLPLCGYLLFTRQWWRLALASGGALLLVMALTIVSVPAFRDLPIGSQVIDIDAARLDDGEGAKLSSANSRVLTLLERVLVVPGRVMNQWYEIYREPSQRENGCGYRVLAVVLNCSYVHIPTKLYAHYYPDRVEEGMQGSLNAVYLMTDYANFGAFGFCISGIVAGVVFAFSRAIYGSGAIATALNLPFLASLMETNVLIALNSGSGWILTTVIFILVFRLSQSEPLEVKA